MITTIVNNGQMALLTSPYVPLVRWIYKTRANIFALQVVDHCLLIFCKWHGVVFTRTHAEIITQGAHIILNLRSASSTKHDFTNVTRTLKFEPANQRAFSQNTSGAIESNWGSTTTHYEEHSLSVR